MGVCASKDESTEKQAREARESAKRARQEKQAQRKAAFQSEKVGLRVKSLDGSTDEVRRCFD